METSFSDISMPPWWSFVLETRDDRVECGERPLVSTDFDGIQALIAERRRELDGRRQIPASGRANVHVAHGDRQQRAQRRVQFALIGRTDATEINVCQRA